MKYCALFAGLCFLTMGSLQAQELKGSKERLILHSQALEGNLLQDSPDREVSVYLPPSYRTQPKRHYPVLYLLHGFYDTDGKWFGWEGHWINVTQVIEASLAEGLSKEMIVVMPNAYNRFKGSMYSASETTGDWETFIASELVSYIDTHYRTIPKAAGRGLAGHSMGGYGTIRLGMKHPEVWSSIYLLSACCMQGTMLQVDTDFMENLEAVNKIEQLDTTGFFEMLTLASAAAWAPDPVKPPLYLDLPFEDGKPLPEIAAKFSANRILYVVDQYIGNLKELQAIGMDAGMQDDISNEDMHRLHELLEAYGVQHDYQQYEGDHMNKIAERIRTEVLPFFSKNLIFE